MVSNQRAAVSEEKSTNSKRSNGSNWLGVPAAVFTAITLLVAAIPALFAALWVHRYGVDVPWKDDWDAAELVVKAHTDTLRWSDLFQQQQEARYVLPKLLFIAASAGGHWDVRRMMIGSVAICGLSALGLFWLLGRSGLNGLTRAFSFWLIALLVFSAAQYEIWPWASGLPCFLVPFFLVSALCFSETGRSSGAKFILCLLLSVVASLTLPQGLLLWALTFPVVLLRGGIRKWPTWLVAWLAVSAAFVLAYFHGYAKPAQLPEFAPAIRLADYAQYFFAFLGGELAYATREHRILVSATTGAVLLALYLAALIRALLHKTNRALLRQLLPWFALGAFAVGAATLASLGRIGFGIDSAISSRYVASSLYLSVAVVALAVIHVKDIVLRPRGVFFTVGIWVSGVLCCGTFLTLFAFASARSVRLMEGAAIKTRLGRGGVVFSQVIDTSAAIQPALYFDAAWVKLWAEKLDTLKLLRPPLVRTKVLDQIPGVPLNEKTPPGELEEVLLLPNESLRATGWTSLKEKARAADAVILAYQDDGDGLFAFAIENEVMRRRDPRTKILGWSGWSATFPRSSIPKNAKLSAWAFDADVSMLHRLRETPAERMPE